MKKSVLSLSGGLDSTSLLLKLLTLEEDRNIKAISFDYGQKHRVELERVKQNIEYLKENNYNIEHTIIDLSILGSLFNSALTSDSIKIPEGHYAESSMKATVVPNRNAIFSSIAYGYALSLSKEFNSDAIIALGIHAGDHCIPACEKVYTNKGLVFIKDIKEGDQVYSFNEVTNLVELKEVKHTFNKGINIEVLNVTLKTGANFKVTSEHHCFQIIKSNFNLITGYQKDILKTTAENLKEGDFIPIMAHNRSNFDFKENFIIDLLYYIPEETKKHASFNKDENFLWFKKNNKVNRFVDFDSFLKLVAWYITEGYKTCDDSKKGANTYGIYIPQSITKNPTKLAEILNLTYSWGFNSKVHGKDTNTAVYFSGPTTKILSKCGDKSYKKEIPEFILELPEFWLNKFLFELIKGDGCSSDKSNTETYSYVTLSKKLKEQIIYLGAKLGYKLNLKQDQETKCYVIVLTKANHKPNLNRLGEISFSPIVSIKKETNNQEVYDLTIEDNHNFFIGENGPVLVSNSIYPDCRKEFRDALEYAFKIGNWDSERVFYYTPYIEGNKFTILQEAYDNCSKLELDFNTIFKNTNTCYNPNEKGESCGKCGSCVERVEAFDQLGIKDPVNYIDTWENIVKNMKTVLKK